MTYAYQLVPHGLYKPMPEDFPQYAEKEAIAQLCERYGVSKTKIANWRREIGIEGLKTRFSETDARFIRENWGAMETCDIAERLGCKESAILTKAKRMGLYTRRKKPSRTGWNFDRGPRQFDGRKAKGIADEAADFIRDHDRTCVYRVDREGRANPKANFWKYGFGSLVLTEAELIAKAERKGWDRDAWKRLAA